MTKIKLIAIDLDETLLDDNKQISDYNKEMILKATNENIKIVISTGRPEIGIKAVLKQLNLLHANTYFIAYNGTRIYNEKTDELIIDNYLTGSDLKEIYKFNCSCNNNSLDIDNNNNINDNIKNSINDSSGDNIKNNKKNS